VRTALQPIRIGNDGRENLLERTQNLLWRLEHLAKRNHEMPEMQLPGGSELLSSGGDPSPATTVPPLSSCPRRKPVNIVDLNLNDNPPESDGEDGTLPQTPVDPSTRSFCIFLFTDNLLEMLI
jgi:hypothetical protein